MKRILLFVVAAIFTTSMAIAQDMGISSISPGPSTILKKGVGVAFTVGIKNFGSASLPAGSQFTISYQINTNTAVSTNGLVTNTAIAPGDTISVNLTQFLSRPTFDNAAVGTVQFCVWTTLTGDVNTANDKFCRDYTLVTYKRDVGISAITNPPANTTIQSGVGITFTFTLNNYGDSAIEAGIAIPIQIRVGTGSPLTLLYTVQSELAAKGNVVVNTIPLTVNAPDGSIQMCFSTNWGANVDDFPGNDQSCNTYNVGVGIIENAFAGEVTVRPNPFIGSTQITYSLASTSEVVLKIYSMNGQEVKTLVNEKQAAGYHAADFDATGLEKGLYIYRLHSGDATKTGKLVLE